MPQYNLRWGKNTKKLVNKANARMSLLKAVSSFGPPSLDLKLIYIQYNWSLSEQSYVLWHGSLILELWENTGQVFLMHMDYSEKFIY